MINLKNILLIEDDNSLAYGIQIALKTNEFNITIGKNKEQCEQLLAKSIYDLVILDVNLPDGSGYDLCHDIRKTSNIPIIFLTALSDEINIIMGLDIGADDYITKPFKIGELISRINAILRRTNQQNIGILESDKITLYLNEIKLFKEQEEISISLTEYKIIKLLMENDLRIMTKEQILNTVWDIDGNYVEENAIAVNIKRIRAKIEENAANPKYIKTIRGLGYIWSVRCEKR